MAKGKGKPTRNGGPPEPVLFPEVTHNQRKFLAAFIETGEIREAAKVSGFSLRIHWHWKQHDETYREAFSLAEFMAADLVQDRARRLALKGTMRPIYQQGVKVGEEEQVYPTLILSILNAYYPELFGRYRADVRHEVSPSFAALREQWEALRAAPPPERDALPPVEDIIEMENDEALPPAPQARLGRSQSKEETFQLLDHCQGLEYSQADYEDVPPAPPEAPDVPGAPSVAEQYEQFRREQDRLKRSR